MHENELAAYANNQRQGNSPRKMEAEALTLGAYKLQYCHDNWDSAERKKLLNEALKFNQRLWTIFQVSLSSEENQLPKNLKLELLRLSAFVDKQIFSIMARPAPEKLLFLIDINLDLAKGLKNDISAAPPEVPPIACFKSVEIKI